MSLIDKVIDRLKQDADEVADDPKLRREGVIDARRGPAQEELRESERKVDRQAAEVAHLERRRR